MAIDVNIKTAEHTAVFDFGLSMSLLRQYLNVAGIWH